MLWASAGATAAVALIVTISVIASSGGSQKPIAGPTTQSASPSPTPDPTTTSPPAPTTPPDDPSTWDQSDTDLTPFTSAALLPQSFTDGKDVMYALVDSSVKSCIQGDMSNSVQSVLNSVNCTQVMTGQYTEGGSGVTKNNDVLVSVQVFAFADAATATQVLSNFPDGGTWDFGLYCPDTGDGANPCTSGHNFRDADLSESAVTDHRYLIEATSLYTNLCGQSTCKTWTDAATKEAIAEAGPQVYAKSS